MTRPGTAPAAAPDDEPLDPVAYRQQMRLLKRMHFARPVMHDGRLQFLSVLTPRLAGGRVQMDVFFTGQHVAVDSAAITLATPAKESHV